MTSLLKGLFEGFASLSDWLARLPDWQQNFIVGVVLLVLPALGVGTWKFAPWWRTKYRRRREAVLQRTEIRKAEVARKMGFSEALVAEEEGLRVVTEAIPRLASTMRTGIERQEIVKKRQAAFVATHPNARQQFNKFWVQHAENLRHTNGRLRKDAAILRSGADMLKESHERYLEWSQRKEGGKPHERWLSGYTHILEFRETVRKGIASFSNAGDRWPEDVRAMHRDLRKAAEEYEVVSMELVAAFRGLEDTCSVIVDAVEAWNRKTWLTRRVASLFRSSKQPPSAAV